MPDMSAVATSTVQTAVTAPPPLAAVTSPTAGQPPTGAPSAPTGDASGSPAKPAEQAQAASPEPKKESDAARFAALAKREREAFKAQQEAKALREQIKAELAQVEAWKAAQGLAKTNPLAFLEQQGLTYEQLTQLMLSGGQDSPAAAAKAVEQRLDAKIQSIEAREQAAKDAQAARQAEESRRTIETHEREAVEFVTGAADKYELTNMLGMQEEVPKLIRLAYQKAVKAGETPKVMTFEEAADLVEKHLEAQAVKVQKAKKFQAKEAPKSAPQGEKRSVESAGTLTNDLTVSTSGPPIRYLSEQERVDNALRVAASLRK